MPTNKSRTAGHRKTHKLVQAWVSPGLYKALKGRAKREGRSIANLVRRELGKLVGLSDQSTDMTSA